MATTDVLTLPEAKSAVNLPDNAPLQEERLSLWVSGISDALDEWAGPIVARTVTNETHHVHGARSLILKQTPVLSLTTVTEWQQGTSTVLTAEDHDTSGTYLLDGVTLFRRESWGGSTFSGIVTVTYQAGRYATTDAVGARYKQVASMALARLWAQYAGAWARGGSTFAGEDEGFVYFRAIEPAAKELGIKKRVEVLVG